MKKILYIGNKLEKHGTAPTSADILPGLLCKEGFNVRAVSSLKNKPARLLHMAWTTISSYKKTDIVLIDTYSTSNFWFAVICGYICKRLKIPYIFILHGGNLDRRFQNISPEVRKIFKEADTNIVPSSYLLDKLSPYLENLRLIPNWINLEQYKFRERKEIEPKLLWVRSFDKVYDPYLALDVVEKLTKKYPNVNLCMVGPEKDGSLARMKDLALKRNLPVSFPGKLEKAEWIGLSEEFDIFLNTTLVDNNPVSVLEAMALGIPVVSTNVGGIPYMIRNEENGLLVEPGNSDAMVEAIINLLQNPELAGRLSKTSREEIEKYDWEQVKPLWLELLS